MADEILSLGDCAKLADVSPSTVKLWMLDGRLPFLKTRGGMRLVWRRDLDRLLADRARRPRGFAAGARVLEHPGDPAA